MIKPTELQQLTKGLNVLYLEDEDNIREETTKNFKRFFNEVHSAENGERGLEIFKERQDEIDLIVSDIQMPILNGLDMIKEMKKINDDTAFVVISAHNEVSLFSKAISIGVDGFLIKPINTETLLEVLHKVSKTIIVQRENREYKTKLENIVKERTEQLEYEMVTDQLTGLPNYRKLNEVLAQNEVEEIILINLDNFDHVNTTYGYGFGDKLLKQFATVCGKKKPEGSEIFRLNSDEFVLIFREKTGKLPQIGKEINKKISQQIFMVDEIEISLTATIGMAQAGPGNILRNAHIAMKEVRQIGKNHYFLYDKNDSVIEEKHRLNLHWSKKVKRAIKEKLIVPYFQPIVDNETREIVKYESLARMFELEEVVLPAYFIEPAILMGMVTGITKVMIDKTFAYLAEKEKEYAFSINLTENDFLEEYIVRYMKKKIKKYGIDPKNITIEILENVSEGKGESVFKQIRKLQEMGFKISIDDFGSEKSNFQRLHKLDVDYIKIDGRYIKDIDTNPNSRKIVKSIVTFAHSVDAKVVAEFVHSEEVFNTLKELKVDYSQGYLFGPPAENVIN